MFLLSLFGYPLAAFVILMFGACMLSLIVSLAVFLIDINTSLAALQLDYRNASGTVSRADASTGESQ